MPKPQTAAQIADAIANLEGQLPTLTQNIVAAEATVADAYASGESPDAALDTLSRAKAAKEGALKALGDLDQRYFDAATAEHEAAAARAKAVIDADRQKFDDAIVKALTPLGALLGDESAVQAMIAKLRDMAEEPFWTKQAAIPLPASPTKPAPRDEVDGHQLTPREQDQRWDPRTSKIWGGHVHVAPAQKAPAFDWTAAQ